MILNNFTANNFESTHNTGSEFSAASGGQSCQFDHKGDSILWSHIREILALHKSEPSCEQDERKVNKNDEH